MDFSTQNPHAIGANKKLKRNLRETDSEDKVESSFPKFITIESKYIRTAVRQLQQSINKINKWATINGFKIPKTKIQCVHFCQLRKMHNDSTLKLDDSEISGRQSILVPRYYF